jgi:hypothetical protein
LLGCHHAHDIGFIKEKTVLKGQEVRDGEAVQSDGYSEISAEMMICALITGE